MPRAYDPGAINFALAERTTAMHAGIVNRIELAVGMEQRKRPAASFNYLSAAFGNIAALRDLYELRQLVGSSGGVFGVDFDIVVA